METIVNKEPPDKRTRPDRAAKIKDRKNGEENVVKCTLSRIIADKDNKDVITKVIKDRVDSVSKRTYLAGVAVNRILKEVFEGVPDAQLHTVSVPSVDQNYIRQLMVGSRQAHMETRDATVERFFHNNYWFREKIEGREATEDEGYAKLVNIAPIPTVKHSFITIDTDGLLGVLKDVGLVKSLEKTLTNKEHWESVFDVENTRSTGKGP
eukprot:gene8415-biopygen3744